MSSGAGGGHTRRGVVRSHTVISTGAGTTGVGPGGDLPTARSPVLTGLGVPTEDTEHQREQERERPRLDMATLLSVDPRLPVAGMRTAARRVLALLEPGVLSVADVSAHLELPAGVVRTLVADLVLSGHVRTDSPLAPVAQPLERELLERVLDGLQRL